MTKQRAYVMCSWFNDKQRAYLKQGQKALKANKTFDYDNSFFPLDGQYKGINVTENPDVVNSPEWQMGTFNNDVQDIVASDIGIALYLPSDPDEGQAWELGMLYSIHKPTLVVVPDSEKDIPLNLMPAIGCTRVITMSELKDFNLNHITFEPFSGKIF